MPKNATASPSGAGLFVVVIFIIAVLAMAGDGHCDDRVPVFNDAAPLALAASADIFSTRYALGLGGSRELNPLGQTEASRLALKGATVVGVTYCVRRLRASGHPGRARALKYVAVAAQLAAAGWNVRNARRAQ